MFSFTEFVLLAVLTMGDGSHKAIMDLHTGLPPIFQTREACQVQAKAVEAYAESLGPERVEGMVDSLFGIGVLTSV